MAADREPVSATRRTLFAGGAALVVASAGLPAAASALVTSTPTELMREHVAVMDYINDRNTPDADAMAACDKLMAIEHKLYAAPITGTADLVAKLYAAGLTTIHGERTDERDEHCFRQCEAWLRANS